MKSKNEKEVKDLDLKATEFKKALTQKEVAFLVGERKLNEQVINIFDLGVNGKRITIPVHDENFKVTDIRLYLPPYNRKGRVQKVIGLKGVNGRPKLFLREVLQLIKLKRHREGSEELDDLEILENLEYLEPIYQLIKEWNFILLVEGELDALAALSSGFLALTNTCGAGSWDEEFSSAIAELRIPVVVCMDADDAGDEGALERASSLYMFGVEVRYIQWPKDGPNGYDVTDELLVGGFPSMMDIIRTAKKYRDVFSLDEVESEDVVWIFKPFIAVKKITLVEGDPGIGKTFLVLEIATAVTRGGKGLPNQDLFEPGIILLMSAEDGLADTLKPRMEKMGADLTKVLAPRELFTLDDKGFKTLDSLIERHQPKLVIIDPMTPFLSGKADTNKATDMRPFFKNLGRLATKFNCSIVVTRHLAKNPEQKGVSKGLGSIDISAAVRSILQVSEDSENKGLKRVTHVKSNIGVKGKTFGYRLDEGIFSWAGELNDIEPEGVEASSELERACDFLREALANGPLNALEVTKQATDIGISKGTLNRAKKKVSIRSKRVTDGGSTVTWKWWLPDCEKSTDSGGQKSQGTQDSQEIHPNGDL